MAKIPVGVTKAIDEIYRLRSEIKILESAEQELAESVKKYMIDNELPSIQTKKAEAVMTIREVREIDPDAYFEAIDEDIDKLLATVKVRIEANNKKTQLGAESYLGKNELSAICLVTRIPSLSVKRLNGIEIPKLGKTSVPLMMKA